MKAASSTLREDIAALAAKRGVTFSEPALEHVTEQVQAALDTPGFHDPARKAILDHRPSHHPYKGDPDYYCLECGLPRSNWRHGAGGGLLEREEAALSLAILSLNTFLDPSATGPEDAQRLEDGAEAALVALDRLRTFVRNLLETP